MVEDIGSGEGFQSGFLLARVSWGSSLLQLVDELFFVLNLDPSIDAHGLSATELLVAFVRAEHQCGFGNVAHGSIHQQTTEKRLMNPWIQGGVELARKMLVVGTGLQCSIDLNVNSWRGRLGEGGLKRGEDMTLEGIYRPCR